MNLRDLLRRHAGFWGPTACPPEAVVLALEADVLARAPRVAGLVSEGAPEGHVELEQFVIGFGLRSRFRPLASGAPYPAEWDAVWPKAAEWLRRVVWGSMKAVSRYLEFGLTIQGYAFLHHPELSMYVAQRMTTWLIEGRCPCSLLALKNSQGGGAVKNFLRRLIRCLREHSLAGWDPQKASLLNFVVQAVKGSRGRKDQVWRPGALVQGMHFFNLYSVSNLRFEDVLVWVCPADGTLNFEGLPCLTCRAKGQLAIVPNAWRTVVRRLLVPQRFGGRYTREDYYNCQNCRKQRTIPGDEFFPGGHYYPADHLVCPKCRLGRLAGAKRSSVYVLQPAADGLNILPLEMAHGGNADLCVNPDWDESEDCSDEDGDSQELVESAECDGETGEPDLSPVPKGSHSQLEAAVAGLEHQQRRLIRLMFWGPRCLELDEAALEMGISGAKARELHRRAMQELKAKTRRL